jgi:hypothetical protein
MGKLGEIYVRTIRDDLGRYPTWPVNYPMELGLIGYYHGKSATFEWIDKLENIGIVINPSFSQKLTEEKYYSRNSTSYKFMIDEPTSKSKVSFCFKKNNSVASQGFEIDYQILPTDVLTKSIRQKISDGLSWNYKWVVVTELWLTKGFTTLISGGNNSSIELMVSAILNDIPFNVANPDLGIKITKEKYINYRVVAGTGIKPYFQVHRLINDEKAGLYLKKYGRNIIFSPDKIK